MKTEQELKNCLESFERRCRIEQNPETLKMWNILRTYTEFILDRRGRMRYDDYTIESDLTRAPAVSLRRREGDAPSREEGVEDEIQLDLSPGKDVIQ